LPSRTNSSFSPNPVVGSGTSTLTIKALPKSQSGTYTLTIKGTSGNLSHSTSTTLVIQ
jgi:serine protease AprX